MLTRRTFLKDATLVALAPSVPAFLARVASAAAPQKDARILVVIQLDGGNDGINTVVPFADEGYAKHRQRLRLSEDSLLKINHSLAFHPSLQDVMELFQQQRLSVVQGVGYPHPNRSHEVSMAVWHTARLDRAEHTGYGWIGRALDPSHQSPRGGPHSLLVGAGATPRALWGRRSVASTLQTLDDLATSINITETLASGHGDGGELDDFLRRTMVDAYTAADVLTGRDERKATSNSYPSTMLSARLQLIARLIKAELGTRVYYLVQPGYDTHSSQFPVHARLLRELGGGLRAFLEDLRAAGLEERVLVLCFSEFGRRVQENGSAGTDHGTAGPLLVAGGNLRGGIHGQTPSLLDLDDGDLKHTIDFRSIYATVLADWLRFPTSPALGGDFDKLELLHTA